MDTDAVWVTYFASKNIISSSSDNLDIDQAPQETFALDEKGRLNSLTTVLTQEVERYNKLLLLIKVSCEKNHFNSLT